MSSFGLLGRLKDLSEVKVFSPETFRQAREAMRDARTEIERVTTAYSELVMTVERAFPGETRHQTALRYIREVEARANQPTEAAYGPRDNCC